MQLAQTLQESQERFRGLCEASFEGILIHDDGRILDANQTLASMVGYELSELVGMEAFRLVAPEWRDFVLQTRLSGYEEPYEAVGLRKDGSTFLAELRGKAIPYAGGTVRVAAIRDVTERKRAEDALRESEERFRLLACTTSDAVWDWDLATGRVWRGEGMLTLFGYAPCLDDLEIAWWHEHIHPDDKARVLSGTYAAIHGGQEFWSDEYRFRRADGSYAYVQDRGHIIRGPDGKAVRMIGGVADITERKRAEEALRESESRYRLLAENATDVIWTVDTKLRTTYISPSVTHLWGYSVEEAMTRTVDQMLTPASLDVAMEALAEELAAENTGQSDPFRSRTLELESVCRDGSMIWTEAKMSGLRDERGRLVGILGVSRDITERKRAEESLRRERDRAQRYLDVAEVILVAISRKEKVTLINRKGCMVLGYNAQEIIGKNWFDSFLPAGCREAVRTVFRRLMAGKVELVEYFESPVLTKSGERRLIAWHNTILTDGAGGIAAALCSGEDITERKRAEEALRESERRYRLLAENVTDVIWTTDMNLRATYISPSVVSLLGYSVEDLMAQRLKNVLTPASLDVAMKVFAEEMATEATEEKDMSRLRTLELEAICKDGSTVWAEARMTFLRDEDKQPVGVLGVSRDITERKRAEDALRESEERYRLLAQNATDIIWIRDLNLRTLYINPAVTRIRGYSVEEAMAHTLEETLTPASLEVARETLAEGLKEVAQGSLPRWWTLELEHICKDGSTVWLETRATGLRDEQGRVVEILGTSRDISERKRAEEALQEAREELESRVERRILQGDAYGLTFRELTVLHLVVAGKSDKEIAAVLGISVLTASKHVANILHKMGAASRTEAGVRAIREGLLD